MLLPRVINKMVAALAFTNAICMVLMSVSSLAWTGTPRAERTNIAVATLQFIALCGTLPSALLMGGNRVHPCIIFMRFWAYNPGKVQHTFSFPFPKENALVLPK